VRKSDLKKNHVPFDEAVSRYQGFIERIIGAKQVIRTVEEKRDVAESVLLRLCAHWERFIDEHLVDCVNRDHTRLREYFAVSIPDNPSWDLCHALIIGASYKDFRSFGALKGFSKKILPDGSNPFLQITQAHTERIDEVYKIRNYLSHYSTASKRALMDVYKDKYEMKKFLEPGQFLLAYKAQRLWKYLDAFRGASNDMQKWYGPQTA
jgi:hypothetical protein